MKSSSFRRCPSLWNTSGWLGTIFNSQMMPWVALAVMAMSGSSLAGGASRFEPPVMNRYGIVEIGLSGLTIVSQCCHTGRSTSFVVRQVCDFKSTMKRIASPSASSARPSTNRFCRAWRRSDRGSLAPGEQAREQTGSAERDREEDNRAPAERLGRGLPNRLAQKHESPRANNKCRSGFTIQEPLARVKRCLRQAGDALWSAIAA